MQFSFSDLTEPIARCFNREVEKFIELIAKQLKFKEGDTKDESCYPQRDRNNFISEIILRRNFADLQLEIRIYPNVFGHFDFKLIEPGGTTIEYTDESFISFFITSQENEGINKMKKFFKVETK